MRPRWLVKVGKKNKRTGPREWVPKGEGWKNPREKKDAGSEKPRDWKN